MGFFDSLQNGVQNFAPMALPVIGAGAGAYFGGPMGALIGSSAGSSIGAMYQNYQNFGFQENQLDYQKKLQKQMFAREDNAVYRRTLDLKRSGLSPVLAAGSAAGSGPIVSTKALERARDPDTAAIIMSLLKMKEDIALTQAQKDLVQTNDAIKNWDLDKFVEYNLPSNASGLAKTIRDLGSLLSGITNQVSGPMRELEQKIQPEGDKHPYKRPFTPESDPIQDWLIKRGYLPPRKR